MSEVQKYPDQSYPSTLCKKEPVKRMNKDISCGIQEQFPPVKQQLACGGMWMTVNYNLHLASAAFLTLAAS